MIAMSFELTLPECLDPDVSPRKHNKALKDAMRVAMETHHRKRIPFHFKRQATSYYGYSPRQKKYMAWKWKKFGSNRDLVKTGRTEREMTANAKISIGGTGTTGLTAKMRLKFGWEEKVGPSGEKINVLQQSFAKRLKRFGGDRDLAAMAARTTQGVTLQRMREEITKITPNELKAFADEWAREYATRMVDGRKRRVMV